MEIPRSSRNQSGLKMEMKNDGNSYGVSGDSTNHSSPIGGRSGEGTLLRPSHRRLASLSQFGHRPVLATTFKSQDVGPSKRNCRSKPGSYLPRRAGVQRGNRQRQESRGQRR